MHKSSCVFSHLQVIEPSIGKGGETIAILAIKVSVKSVFSRLKLDSFVSLLVLTLRCCKFYLLRPSANSKFGTTTSLLRQFSPKKPVLRQFFFLNTVHTFFRYKITPACDINFGPLVYGNRKSQALVIKNVGVFETQFTISRMILDPALMERPG